MADALTDALSQGLPVPGVGPVPDAAMGQLIPFQPAPPAAAFKPAPAAPPLPVPTLDELAANGWPAPLPSAPVGAPPGKLPPAPDIAGPGQRPTPMPAEPDLAAQQALAGEAEKVAQAEGAQKVKAAEVDAANADEVADQRAIAAEAKRKAVQRGLAYEAEAMDRWHKAVDRLSDQKIESYWSNKTTGEKVAAGIALAFGALGAGLTGFAGKSTGNLAAEALNRTIDLDFQRQRANIENLKDVVAIARTGIQDAREAKKSLMEEVDATEAAALKSIEARAIANLKAQGVPAAEIATHKTIIELRQKQMALEATTRAKHQKDVLDAIKNAAEVTRLYADAERDLAQAGKLKRRGTGAGAGTGPTNGVEIKGPDGKTIATIPFPAWSAGKGGATVRKDMFDDARKVSEGVAAARDADNALAELNASYDKHGIVSPFSKEYQDRQALVGRIKTQSAKAQGLGAIAKEDLDIVQQQFSNEAEVLMGRGGPKIKRSRSLLRTGIKHQLDARGANGTEAAGAAFGDAAPAAKSAAGAKPAAAKGGQPAGIPEGSRHGKQKSTGKMGWMTPDGKFIPDA